jgi:hypothetical protein
MNVIKTLYVASLRCEIGSCILRKENGLRVERKIVWKRKRRRQKKYGEKLAEY